MPIDQSPPLLPDAPQRYDEASPPAKPRRRMLRTLLNRPRPARRFAPRIKVDLSLTGVDPAIAAHWGEYLLVEDVASILHRDGTVTWLRHVVAWLFGANQLSEWDEITRFYDSRKELHRVLTAKLYPVEGAPRAIKGALQTFSAPGTRTNRYGRSLRFNYQPLRPGVIAEFEEQYDGFVADPTGPLLINQFFLRTAAPCVRRRYTAAVAAPFTLNYRVHHAEVQPTLRQDKHYTVATWDVQNAEGVEHDAWNPPARDFIPWIDVSTAEDWGRFAWSIRQELLPPVGATPSAASRRLARELAAEKSDQLAKAQGAYAYAARQVRYGRPPAEQEARNTRAVSKMFEDLRGDCKDKSSLLIELLRLMGIEAEMAVILTADEGRTEYLPASRFNHAIVRAVIDGTVHWLDAASGLFSFGQLPENDLAVAALMLDGDHYRFTRVDLPDARQFETKRRWQGGIDDQGGFAGTLHAEFNGEMAARLRHALLDRTAKHCHEALRSWLGNEYPGFESQEFQYSAPDDLSEPLTVSCVMKAERVARWVQDALLLQPPWFGQLGMSGPFAAATRRQPLVAPAFYQIEEQFEIDLPASVTPLATPDPAWYECAWGRYRCEFAATASHMSCTRRLQLTGGGAVVPTDRYGEFRRFWQQACWADANPAVMTRAPRL